MAIKIYLADGTKKEVKSLENNDFEGDVEEYVAQNFGTEAGELISKATEFSELSARATRIGFDKWIKEGHLDKFKAIVAESVSVPVWNNLEDAKHFSVTVKGLFPSRGYVEGGVAELRPPFVHVIRLGEQPTSRDEKFEPNEKRDSDAQESF